MGRNLRGNWALLGLALVLVRREPLIKFRNVLLEIRVKRQGIRIIKIKTRRSNIAERRHGLAQDTTLLTLPQRGRE